MKARKRILVVDDDVHVRKLLTLYLGAAGLEVREAASGDEALRLWGDDGAFDLVLLDLILPHHGGFRLCQRFKEGSSGPIVVIMTGDATPETRLSAKECGADDFIAKPFDPTKLVARLKELLEDGPRLAAASE